MVFFLTFRIGALYILLSRLYPDHGTAGRTAEGHCFPLEVITLILADLHSAGHCFKTVIIKYIQIFFIHIVSFIKAVFYYFCGALPRLARKKPLSFSLFMYTNEKPLWQFFLLLLLPLRVPLTQPVLSLRESRNYKGGHIVAGRIDHCCRRIDQISYGKCDWKRHRYLGREEK